MVAHDEVVVGLDAVDAAVLLVRRLAVGVRLVEDATVDLYPAADAQRLPRQAHDALQEEARFALRAVEGRTRVEEGDDLAIRSALRRRASAEEEELVLLEGGGHALAGHGDAQEAPVTPADEDHDAARRGRAGDRERGKPTTGTWDTNSHDARFARARPTRIIEDARRPGTRPAICL